jgi:glycosyltransferase involved in cell wall biosynthesis
MTWAAKAIERLVVHEADRVVWFDGIQLPDDYFERYDIPDDRVVQLPPMGYEKGKFDTADAADYDEFTITYAGSFYEGWIEPYAFLEGLGRYIDRTGDRTLRVQFYGDWTAEYEQAASEIGVEEFVRTHEFVPHDEIVPVLKGSDTLLYIGGTDSGNRLNLPSKLWDYVGAQRPILAVVEPTFRVAEFLREHDLGLVADANDPESIANALESLRDDYTFAPDPPVFERYTRERSAERIAEILDEITAAS